MSDFRAGPWTLPIPRFLNLHTTGLSAPVSINAPVVTPVGLYRVSMSIAITTAGSAGQLIMSVVSNGEGGSSQIQSLAAVSVNTLGDLAQDAFVVDVASANVSYKVDGVGLTAGSLKYAIRLVIEQISALP